MADTISYSFSVEVGSEVEFNAGGEIPIDGYHRNRVTVEGKSSPGANAEKATLEDAFPLKSSNGTSAIQFVLISSNRYEALSFSVDGGSNFVELEQPLLLTTRGAIDAFGISSEDIEFENDSQRTHIVEVVVGRST